MWKTTQLIRAKSSNDLSQTQGSDGKDLSIKKILSDLESEIYKSRSSLMSLNDKDELKDVVKLTIALSVKPAKISKECNNFAELVDMTGFEEELEKFTKNLIASVPEVGTHIPKATSSQVNTGALYFHQQPKLKSGITSASTFGDHNYVTGSKNGARSKYYKLLSVAHHVVGEDAGVSMFDRIANKDEAIKSALVELNANEDVFDALHTAVIAAQNKELEPVSQFSKQNINLFAGEKIVTTPLMSVSMTLALEKELVKQRALGCRIRTVRLPVGGSNAQNISCIHPHIGGGQQHLEAWIPKKRDSDKIFKIASRISNFRLSHEQKVLVSTLSKKVYKATVTAITREDKDFLYGAVEKITNLFVSDLETVKVAIRLQKSSEATKLAAIFDDRLNCYIEASTKAEVRTSASSLAVQIATAIKREMNINQIPITIDEKMLKMITKTLKDSATKWL